MECTKITRRKRFYNFRKKHGGWKTRLGFYLIIGSYIFQYFNYAVPECLVTIGFAIMLLGIAHKK
jgi:hypothetical protein